MPSLWQRGSLPPDRQARSKSPVRQGCCKASLADKQFSVRVEDIMEDSTAPHPSGYTPFTADRSKKGGQQPSDCPELGNHGQERLVYDHANRESIKQEPMP